jgi:16S rRNA A1518/A1519 N6-dimethyltransferase RsmA/KsgA/DIM1 with predicted DNA glycosylase/AP lyase activity
MVQDEVGQKIKSDAKKKSYLRRLLNYAYDVTYLKGVPAKCFKPTPKVKSCLIQLTTKSEQLTINRDRFIEFLELFAPFSRKTLGAIQKMIKKKSEIKFIIPESLQKKRLEELDRTQIQQILR